MSGMTRAALAAVVAAVFAAPLAAGAPITIKLATAAPAGSSWDKELRDMGATWAAKTAGRVTLRVYAGGQQGDELTTIRMMRPGVDQLQANLLMVAGLSSLNDGFNVFGMPFFFQNDDEARDVELKLAPVLEQRVEAKGFRILAWGSAGWVQIFSKTQLHSLDDVKHVKLYTSQGDDRMVQWYKANGFNPVALSATDIPGELRQGMIDAAPSPAYPALLLQMFREAKYMLDVHVAPLVGALVISNDAWNKIDAADRPMVSDAAKAFEQQNLAEAPKQDADSLTQMKTRGLTVTTLDPKTSAEFHAAADKLVTTMRGNMVPADIYDMAVAERDAYRKAHAH